MYVVTQGVSRDSLTTAVRCADCIAIIIPGESWLSSFADKVVSGEVYFGAGFESSLRFQRSCSGYVEYKEIFALDS